MKLLGTVMAFNEADVVELPLRCLLGSGHHVLLFDHGSQDETGRIARSMGAEVIPISRRVPFPHLFGVVSRHIRERAKDEGYQWVTWLDADEILRPPDGGELTWEALEQAAQTHDVIRPLIREFWVTDADQHGITNPILRMRHYRPRSINCPRSWRIELTKRMPFGLHRKQWPKGTRVDHGNWLLDHYRIRSKEHAVRKIMRERPAGDIYQVYRSRRCSNVVRNAAEMHKL